MLQPDGVLAHRGQLVLAGLQLEVPLLELGFLLVDVGDLLVEAGVALVQELRALGQLAPGVLGLGLEAPAGLEQLLAGAQLGGFQDALRLAAGILQDALAALLGVAVEAVVARFVEEPAEEGAAARGEHSHDRDDDRRHDVSPSGTEGKRGGPVVVAGAVRIEIPRRVVWPEAIEPLLQVGSPVRPFGLA